MTTIETSLGQLIKNLAIRAVQGTAVAIAGWFVNWLSLSGVDFKSLGLDSETVKQVIVGSVFMAVTSPMEIFKLIGEGILQIRIFFHTALGYVVCGIKKPLPPDEPEKPNE